jgi:hypothetical protein
MRESSFSLVVSIGIGIDIDTDRSTSEPTPQWILDIETTWAKLHKRSIDHDKRLRPLGFNKSYEISMKWLVP